MIYKALFRAPLHWNEITIIQLGVERHNLAISPELYDTLNASFLSLELGDRDLWDAIDNLLR